MSRSTELIQKYFHLKSNSKMDNIISQLDNISDIRRIQLDADFVGMYYSKDSNEPSVALSFSLDKNKTYQSLDLIEQVDAKSVEEYLSQFSEKVELFDTDQLSGNLKTFAKKNNFSVALIYSHRFENGHSNTIVTFWSEMPRIIPEKVLKISKSISQILGKQILILEDIQSVDQYSSRLSELIQIFEMPIGDYQFKDFVNTILKQAKPLVPVCGVALFSKEIKQEEFRIQEFSADETTPKSFAKSISKKVKSYFSKDNKFKGEPERWVDFGREFKDDFTSVMALEFSPEKFSTFVIVLWTDKKSGFSKSDRDLLMVFSLFARSILKNALVVRNIRRAKKAVEKSSAKMADLETTAALADMTSGVAHEFNNIIGGVVGRIQLIKLKLKDENLKSELDKIESMVMEGARTVKRIQEYTTGAKFKDLAPISLSRVVKDVLIAPRSNWKLKAASRDIDIVTNIAVSEGTVNGSAEDLIDVIGKLIENAVDFSPIGSEVEVSLTDSKNSYKLTVSDQGPGIPSNNKTRIFYPFFTTKSDRLSGLGLSIVHGIITRHGGSIKVLDNSPKGSIFEIQIPKAEVTKDETDITRTSKVQEFLNILVVDDDDQIREVLRDILLMHGHTLTTCADGISALKEFKKQKFDLMITDLGMPGMSGMELAEQVHKDYPDLPIAMITGWGTQLDPEQVKENGILSVLSKPFHLKEIKELIEEVV